MEYLIGVLLRMALGDHGLVLSQTIGFACDLPTNFLLNRSWVFRSNGAAKTELLKYSALAGIGLVAGTLAMLMLTGTVELNQDASKLLMMTCNA